MAEPRDSRSRRPKPRPAGGASSAKSPGDRARGRSKGTDGRPSAGPTEWGGVARRGAGRMRGETDGEASGLWRAAMEKERAAPRSPSRAKSQNWEPERWVRDDVRDVAAGAVARGELRPSRRPAAPRQAARGDRTRVAIAAAERAELGRGVSGERAATLARRLADATRAFERERFGEARRMLKPLSERAPGAAGVRELHGLTLYRLGKWRDAVRELEAFRAMTGSTEQHPVLADCYRALGRWAEVDELWEELRASSPRAELVAEGRIVAAGARADRGDLRAAIAVLEPCDRPVKRPRDHHLRLWYALADLYERAGEMPVARQLFGRIATVAPDFADASQRRRALH